jgi:hypothetical protein
MRAGDAERARLQAAVERAFKIERSEDFHIVHA